MKDKQMVGQTYAVKGMTCESCEARVEGALRKLSGVAFAKADFMGQTVVVRFDPALVDEARMFRAVEAAGYQPGALGVKRGSSPMLAAGVLLVLGLLVLGNTLGVDLLPRIGERMGYGLLFLTGLLTSLHCVAMCGGISLSQCAGASQSGRGSLFPSALYNLGRTISYTLIGGIVGALGASVPLPASFRAAIPVIAGLFMLAMALNMLGLFPWLWKLTPRMPRAFSGLTARFASAGPLVVGLFNGLMPCGPLQSMQLYALGTGSFAAGALSMLCFSLGTVPLMFALGALGSLMGGKVRSRMRYASAALVLVLGVVMIGRGVSLSGGVRPLSIAQPDVAASQIVAPQTEEAPSVAASTAAEAPQVASERAAAAPQAEAPAVQRVVSELQSRSYPQITVQKGIPVEWTIKATANVLNGCNDEIIIPALNKDIPLNVGDNVITFTPTEAGTIPYTCWMGMIYGSITVEG